MYVLVCICLYETKLAYLEDYHVRSLPFEWHGMNGLLSQPIPVIDFDTGEELQGAGHVRHVRKPFQHRMELARRKLLVPAIRRWQVQAGHPIEKIIQNEMNQFVREVVED